MQNMPEEELMEKEAALAAEVERSLPDFVNFCRDKADVVIIRQDAWIIPHTTAVIPKTQYATMLK